MSPIYWHIQDLKKVPKDNNWLAPEELIILNKLRFLKRRTEWRLGRWTVKNAIQKYFLSEKIVPLETIAILSKENGAPYIKINNELSKLILSISHRERKALCALTESPNTIGSDLEFIEQRSDIFISDYFTQDEIKLVRNYKNQKDMVANLIWSAKESVSKVVQLGLNLSTHDVNIHTIQFDPDQDWSDLNITMKNSTPFYGKWMQINKYILTIASKEPLENIIHL